MVAKPETFLVTGAYGFVGQRLCQTLLKEGEVVGFGRVPSDPGKLESLSRIGRDRRFHHYAGDLRSFGDLSAAFQQYKPDVVIHLGAMARVLPDDPEHRMLREVNVGGTRNLVRAIQDSTSSHLPMIFASTVRVYDAHTGPVDGTTPIDPDKIGPYARSKHDAEGIVIDCGGNVARLPNGYGPGQRVGSGIVPNHIDATLRGEHPEVHGSGNQRIDLTYIDDFVRAILASMRGQQGTVYAVGSGNSLTVRDAAHAIQTACGRGLDNIKTVPLPTGAVEGGIYWVDPSEMHKLGWEPMTSLHDGLGETVQWHRARLGGDPQRRYSVQQSLPLPLPLVFPTPTTSPQVPLGAA
ncbi:NAD(P)-dependent oxidoreductase [Candidatus Woesebacteria bacterium]|nr:NAD(P)-dependent oxidoreductase [Candidatus Woesebacteria bacterium]